MNKLFHRNAASTWAALGCLFLMPANRVSAQQFYVDVDQTSPVFSVYDDILAKDPKNAEAYRMRGTAYYHEEKFDLAIADYNQAIALNAKDAIAYAGRGLSHFKQSDLDGAIADLQRAARLSPNSVAIYNHLVDVYWRKQDWDNVISNATQTIRVNPSQSAWACDVRGTAYQNKGDLDRALKEFATSIRLRPDWDAPHRDRASALNKKGDFDGALGDLKEAIRLDPHNEQNYDARSGVYQGKKDWDGVIANWTEAIANNPTNTLFLTARGNVYQFHKNDLAKAIADYNKAVELQPNDPYSYMRRAYAYEREKLYEKAIPDFSKMIELSPTNSHYYNARADAYAQNGQYREARDDFKQAIQLSPEEWNSYSELAYFLATCPDASFRNGDEALKMARKGCELNQQPGDWPDCNYALAAAYAEIGDFDDAIHYQKQLLDKVSNAKGWGVTEDTLQKIKECLALFEQHKPYREPVKSARKP